MEVKKPIIYRTTPQWFISMKTNNLKDKAMQGIEDTNGFLNPLKIEYKVWLRIDQIGVFQDKGHGEYH